MRRPTTYKDALRARGGVKPLPPSAVTRTTKRPGDLELAPLGRVVRHP